MPPSSTICATVISSKKLAYIMTNIVQSSSSRKQALAKLRTDNVLPTGAENYVSLQNFLDNEQMQSFAEFFKWYNKKDVVSTLEAVWKRIEIYHNK